MAARKPKPAPEPAAAPSPAGDAVANLVRGEVSITLEGVRYLLRPSFEAAAQIESASGKSIHELTEAAEAWKLTLTQAGLIVAMAMRAAARAGDIEGNLQQVRPERIAELIFSEPGGLHVQLKLVIAPMLRGMIFGAYTALGKVRAAETTGTTTNPTTNGPGSAA